MLLHHARRPARIARRRLARAPRRAGPFPLGHDASSPKRSRSCRRRSPATASASTRRRPPSPPSTPTLRATTRPTGCRSSGGTTSCSRLTDNAGRPPQPRRRGRRGRRRPRRSGCARRGRRRRPPARRRGGVPPREGGRPGRRGRSSTPKPPTPRRARPSATTSRGRLPASTPTRVEFRDSATALSILADDDEMTDTGRPYVVVAALGALVAFYPLLPAGPVRETVYPALGLLCVVVGFVGLARNVTGRRAGWLLVLGGFAGWVVGDVGILRGSSGRSRWRPTPHRRTRSTSCRTASSPTGCCCSCADGVSGATSPPMLDGGDPGRGCRRGRGRLPDRAHRHRLVADGAR